MNLRSLRLIMIPSIALALSACAGAHKEDQQDAFDLALDSDSSELQLDSTEMEVTSALKPETDDLLLDEEFEPTPKRSARKPASQKVTGGNVPADKALGWMKNGNRRFATQQVRADGISAADRARLALGEKPHSTVFACSDSRMPPEVVFDQKLGEIYVVRNDELKIDQSAITSLEKAVDKFGTQLLVVLGNNDCGNPEQVANDLASRSKLLGKKISSGQLRIEPATYNLKSGSVKFE